ncbi:MAG: hypothetical protein ACI9ON_000138 [Limisphaerales bacterium]|jgi:hypothetical protein
MGFTVRQIFILSCLLGFALPAFSEVTLDGNGGPLRVRNVSPVIQLYGLPRPVGARIVTGDMEVSYNFEAVNNFQSDLQQGTFAFFDGETYINSYRIRNDFADKWEWGIELPWIVHTPGSLDGVVDEFHELFGLPDGERSLATRGRLDYYIASQGTVYADFNNSRREIGDLRASLGHQLFDNSAGALTLRTQAKFPTGEVSDLTGSGGLDLSMWGEYEYSFALRDRRIRLSVAGGISHLGEGDLIPEHQETWVHFGHVGIQIPLHRRVEFHFQVDAHSSVLNTGNPLIADGGVLGTLGGRVGVTERLWVDLAIIEDLNNEAAADVVFQILLGARL